MGLLPKKPKSTGLPVQDKDKRQHPSLFLMTANPQSAPVTIWNAPRPSSPPVTPAQYAVPPIAPVANVASPPQSAPTQMDRIEAALAVIRKRLGC